MVFIPIHKKPTPSACNTTSFHVPANVVGTRWVFDQKRTCRQLEVCKAFVGLSFSHAKCHYFLKWSISQRLLAYTEKAKILHKGWKAFGWNTTTPVYRCKDLKESVPLEFIQHLNIKYTWTALLDLASSNIFLGFDHVLFRLMIIHTCLLSSHLPSVYLSVWFSVKVFFIKC